MVTLAVTRRDELADGVVGLSLQHPDGGRLPDWTPGSHIDLILPNGMTRQYSLCGDRWDASTYRIGVLRGAASRGGSAYIHDVLRPGDRVGVGGPRNNFPLVPSEEYVFIAGGIGITPLLPMIIQAELLDARWSLLYGGRRRASMAFLDALTGYGDRVEVVPEQEFGLLELTGLVEPRPGATVYCCGPAPLLDAVGSACQAWPAHRLRTERFTAKAQDAQARNEPFEVELRRSGITVTVPPELSVLAAVRGAGVDMLSSCAQGICGTCETTVLAGRPDHRDSILTDQERANADCMFICVSRSHTDRLVVDL
jgi:ferredoxin-NADP reductase